MGKNMARSPEFMCKYNSILQVTRMGHGKGESSIESGLKRCGGTDEIRILILGKLGFLSDLCLWLAWDTRQMT